MSSEITALKPSFFKEYFRHKLRGLRKFTITFAVMNFLIYTVFTALMLGLITEFKLLRDELIITHTFAIAASIYALVAATIFAAEGILIIVMAAMNLKSYHSRSAMDTIGGLPLTTAQRFWGDVLSGLTSFMISFIPCAVSSLIMMAILQYGIDPEAERYKFITGVPDYIFPRFHDNYLILAALLILTLLICVLAAYAITCFVTSCCGRLNISIIFSILTVCAIALIVVTFNTYINDLAVGISGGYYGKAIAAFPPVGTAIYLVYTFMFIGFDQYEFTVATPKLITMLAFIVLPMIGSYLIAKHRKAEGVDKPFIYKPAYIVVSLLITASAFGITLITLEMPAFYVPVLIFAFAACVYIEYLRTHSKRTFWIGVLRFAGSAAACAVFGVLAYNTDGFNIGKKLPAENSIESVKIYYLDEAAISRPILLDDKNVISAVLSEHKKITDNIEKFSPRHNKGHYRYESRMTLNLEYNLSDGTKTQRIYYPMDEETAKMIQNFKTAIRSMPEVHNRTLLGILGNPSIPCTKIELLEYEDKPVNSNIIKPSAQEEFIRCLKNDMMNNEFDIYVRNETVGYFSYSYVNSGIQTSTTISIFKQYKETIEFLSNPDNYLTDFSFNVDNASAVYRVVYRVDNPDGYSFSALICDVKADSAAAHELISYFETEYSADGDFSEKITVSTDGISLRIKQENERAALSALIKVMKEQETRGELS